MKHLKRIAAAALSVLLCATFTASAVAETAPSEKEEVIYIMTDAAGKVTDIEAVNIFAGGDITDYGDYAAVKLLNTTDSLTQNGDRITFSSAADKVYYQGTLRDTTIPWDISVRYFLDGTEYTAADVAGKSGALEIRFSVTKNEGCRGSFYEDYALQASFTLDTARCKNITADGATVANVGSDKQLTYTILPGKGIDTVIRADVTDFEMDAVAINGVRLALSFEVDDTVLTDKVNELTTAIDALSDGAAQVRDGSGELRDATGTLVGKVGELHAGVDSLTGGAGAFADGLATVTERNGQLTDAAYAAYEGLCTAAAAALNAQLRENGMDAVTLTPKTYAAVLTQLLQKTDADAVYKEAYAAALQQVTESVSAQAETLYTQVAAQAVCEQLMKNGYTAEQATAFLQTPAGQAAVAQAVAALTEEQKATIRAGYIDQLMASDEVTAQIAAAVSKVSEAAGQIAALKGQLDSYGAFYTGLLDYTGAVGSAAAGAESLKQNMDTLCDSKGTLGTAVGALHDAADTLYGGTKELANGATTLAGETAGMDTQIQDEIDSMLASVTGGDTATVSFVSEKNTSVRAVQFVIKTAAVEKAPVAADSAEEEAPLTFWQKLLRLFGLY